MSAAASGALAAALVDALDDDALDALAERLAPGGSRHASVGRIR